jgi:hypothetical protein
MKVSEILVERHQDRPNQINKDPSVSAKTNSAFAPGQSDARNYLVGSAKDWMLKYGFTNEDIAQALEKVLDSPMIGAIERLGYKLKNSAVRLKSGTINFARGDKEYQIHSNGQIRGGSPDQWGGVSIKTYRLASPVPDFSIDSKHKVDDLIANYKSSLERLYEVLRKPK